MASRELHSAPVGISRQELLAAGQRRVAYQPWSSEYSEAGVEPLLAEYPPPPARVCHTQHQKPLELELIRRPGLSELSPNSL